jgi:transcriptional regulator with XRE-family HTH domain
MITPEQLRAARALLGMDQAELARRAQVSVTTVRRMESEDPPIRVAGSTVDEICRVLETAGIEFIDNGVRRRRMSRRDPETLYREMRLIAQRSALLLDGQPPLSEADLYDDHGLPA